MPLLLRLACRATALLVVASGLVAAGLRLALAPSLAAWDSLAGGGPGGGSGLSEVVVLTCGATVVGLLVWVLLCVLTCVLACSVECVAEAAAGASRTGAGALPPARGHGGGMRLPVPTSLLQPPLLRLAVGLALGVGALPSAAAASPAALAPGACSRTAPVRGTPSDLLSRLDGLRLPERTTGQGRVRTQGPPAALRTHRVVPGDSLWTIAAARLPPGAAAREVDTAWRAVYALNRDVVGPDPDVLLPGATLRLPAIVAEPPPTRHHRETTTSTTSTTTPGGTP